MADPANCDRSMPAAFNSAVEWRYCNPAIEDGLASTCYDNFLNQHEIGVDCGGECPGCVCEREDIECLCHNGIFDQESELDVDCGGDCDAPCPCALKISGTIAVDHNVAGNYAQVYGTSEYLDLGGSGARVSWALGEWSVTNASGAVLFAHAGGAEAPACVLQFSAPLANLIWCCTVGVVGNLLPMVILLRACLQSLNLVSTQMSNANVYLTCVECSFTVVVMLLSKFTLSYM